MSNRPLKLESWLVVLWVLLAWGCALSVGWQINRAPL